MIKLKNLILFELLSILLLCTVIGGILYSSDLSTFWRERYSRDSGVIRQAFLDHRNEILNGNTRGFESTLSAIANVYAIRAFEVNYQIVGRVVRISRDPSVKAKELQCAKATLKTWITGSSACFSTDFRWENGDSEPILSLTWWVLPDGLERQKHSAILMLASALVLGIAFCGIHWLMLRKVIVRPISQAVERFGTWVRDEGVTPSVKSLFMPKTREISDLILHFDHLLNAAEDNRSLRELTIQLQSTELVAKQVSHDLRSPLSALKVAVESMNRSPSDDARALAQRAFLRVNEILASLSQTALRQVDTGLLMAPRVENVFFIIESILAEHRLQIDSTRVSLHFDYSELPEVYVKADWAGLKRAISNLLNNAIEALPERTGQINVQLADLGEQAQITIHDNGQGIPLDILHRMGEKGFTLGKDSGSGLGVFQAKNAIESCGGQLIYTSQQGQGTSVAITLPKSVPPPYRVEAIPTAALMVVVDDDISMHRAWREKFATTSLRLKCFLSANKFETWYAQQRPAEDTTFYLFDFSLGPHEPTGFELIMRNALPASRVMIVSGIADSLEVQMQAERSGTKLLHKRYVASKILLRSESAEATIAAPQELRV